MLGKQNTQQATSGILLGVPQTGTNLPVHMLSLPGAGAYQHNRDSCVSNEIVSDSSANFVQGEISINYVSNINRSVYYIVSHHLNESVFVLLILVMVVADEDLVSRGLRHCYFIYQPSGFMTPLALR